MFPFTIKFEENISIDLNKIGVENVLNLIKENTITESNKKVKEIEIKDNTLRFRIGFAAASMYNDFYSVIKGEFNISLENDVTILTYKYLIGNDIYLPVGAFSLLAFISLLVDKNQDNYRFKIPILFVLIWGFLVWLAALLHQYLFFRRIVKRIEEKWVY